MFEEFAIFFRFRQFLEALPEVFLPGLRELRAHSGEID
jgi:hypothetical protein